MEATSRCPYPVCSKLFSNCYNLKKHINSHHLKLKPFKCSYCDKVFGYKHSMLHHQYTHEQVEKPQYSGSVESLDLCKMLEVSKDPDLCPYARMKVKRMKRRRSQQGLFELLPEIKTEKEEETLPRLALLEPHLEPF